LFATSLYHGTRVLTMYAPDSNGRPRTRRGTRNSTPATQGSPASGTIAATCDNQLTHALFRNRCPRGYAPSRVAAHGPTCPPDLRLAPGSRRSGRGGT